MSAYERATNTCNFDAVAPLIADNAVYWFTDVSVQGLEEIRRAFEETWASIRDETYTLDHLQWLITTDEVALCIYHFHSRGEVNGKTVESSGRGTNVLRRLDDGRWVMAHEHLSKMP